MLERADKFARFVHFSQSRKFVSGMSIVDPRSGGSGYNVWFRSRVLATFDQMLRAGGLTKPQAMQRAADHWQLHVHSVLRWLRQREAIGHLSPAVRSGGPSRSLNAMDGHLVLLYTCESVVVDPLCRMLFDACSSL